MKKVAIILFLCMGTWAHAQTEHAIKGTFLTDLQTPGFGAGYVNILHDHMGGKKLRSFYLDVEMGLGRGFAFNPRAGWAFSPVFNKKDFHRKTKIRTNFVEISVSPGFYFKDSLGITFRPEVAYLLNTPFESLKARISYGYQFGIYNREFTAPRRNFFGISLLWYFRLTGMFI